MPDTLNHNAVACDAINNDVRLARIDPRGLPQLWSLSSCAGILRKKFERADQMVAIGDGLFDTECLDCISGD